MQHRAPENAETEWAQGQNGYLKQSEVIAMFEEAGFTLVAESAVNANLLIDLSWAISFGAFLLHSVDMMMTQVKAVQWLSANPTE